jgi:uroporphyrinogen-III synthase
LAAAGARVVPVPAPRIDAADTVPTDPTPLFRLVDLITNRLVDAVAFTAAPAVTALLSVAGVRATAVLSIFRTGVLAACPDPGTAAALRRHAVPVAVPTLCEPGALVQLLAEELPRRSVEIRVGDHLLTLRGHDVLLDGRPRALAPGPMAVLRALAVAPGRVVSRSTLRRALPRDADAHAVEMAVARLRATLPVPGLIRTAARRGYRLGLD